MCEENKNDTHRILGLEDMADAKFFQWLSGMLIMIDPRR
jgi:hypothetical protein